LPAEVVEHGKQFLEELRSFEPVEAGITGEFTTERRTHEKYGTSFLLKRQRGPTADRLDGRVGSRTASSLAGLVPVPFVIAMRVVSAAATGLDAP
jgi:hypothetical protein